VYPASPAPAKTPPGPGLGEASAVWGLFAVTALLVFSTYARVSTEELYHVSDSGLAGGAGRTLVFLGYPTALAAVAILAIALDRLLAAEPPRSVRRAAVFAAPFSLVLCSTVAWPGVVDQDDLDAKPVNALAAAGVVLALALTVAAAVRAGFGGWTPRRRGDRARIVVAAVLLVVGLPWILADLGVFVDDLPVLGLPYYSDELSVTSSGELLPAVHLGHHHGLDGVLLALTALLLTRALHRMRETRLRTALALYLSLMLVYGIGNAAQDAWLEQLVKRGWTSWEIPSMIRPELLPIWGIVLALGAAVHLAFWRRSRLSVPS
jgi:hypothetical protein